MLRQVSEWNWTEIVKVIISVYVAAVATIALTTWKKQSKAQRQIDFMDALADSVHEFIASLVAPIEMVKIIKIGIESHKGIRNLNTEIKNPEAVAYIQKRGKDDSMRLNEYLKACGTSLAKIRSLSAKGQVLGLKNYKECYNACKMLTSQYDRMQSLCYMIGSENLYWENPVIQETLSKVLLLEPDEINKEIEEQYIIFLTYVKENYEQIYK